MGGPNETLVCAEIFWGADQYTFVGRSNTSESYFAYTAGTHGNQSSPANKAVRYPGGMVAYRGQMSEVGELLAFGEPCVGDVLGEPFIAFAAQVYNPKIEDEPFNTLLVFHPASRKLLALASGANASLPGCVDAGQRASSVVNSVSCGSGFVAVQVCGGLFNTDCTGNCTGVYAVSVSKSELTIGEPFATRATIGGISGPYVGRHSGRRSEDQSISSCIVGGDQATVYRATVQG